MIYDSHLHTEFSSDSRVCIKDYIALSKQNNTGLVITDHCDYDEDHILDKEGYFTTYQQINDENVLLGVELGLNTLFSKQIQSFADDDRFDFILGSVHSLGTTETWDYVNENLLDIDKVLFYYEHALKQIRFFDCFDAFGHIDYPLRYIQSKIYLNDERLRAILIEIFTELIRKDKIIEINTKLFDDDAHYLALIEMYQLYYDLGGRYITFGSDAHHVYQFNHGLNKLESFLNETNLTLVYFNKRMKKEIKI